MATEWYCQILGQEIGPLSPRQLRDMAQSGRVQPDTPIRKGREGEWVIASRVKGRLTVEESPEKRHKDSPTSPPADDQILDWLLPVQTTKQKQANQEVAIKAPIVPPPLSREIPTVPTIPRPTPRSTGSDEESNVPDRTRANPKLELHKDAKDVTTSDSSNSQSRHGRADAVFFSEGNVLVTTTRFVVDHTVYPISAIASIWMYSEAKPRFAVVITTVAGEVTAVSSASSQYIKRIAGAVEDAIISRG